MANSRKKISELPALSVASLDTTFVLGISGSTTYKISINNLTSSLDGAFATDLVTNALSNTLDTKLSTSSFNSYTASISTGSLITSISNLNTFTASVTTASIVTSISNLNTFTASISTASLVTSISNLNTFTASQSTSSLVNRLNAIESVSGSWITESETGSFLTSLSGAISSSSQLTSSLDTRYTLSGSVQPLPSNLLSSSAQITAFGFISSSTAIPAGTISGSAQITTLGFISSSQTINTSSFATTGSNTFNGNQQITGSLLISQNITGSASASFVSLAVNTTTPTQKIHLKGAVGVENGTTGGNTADQFVFGYAGSNLTQYTHKIQTGHDAQAALNRMDFLISNAASTWKTPLQLRHDRVIVSGSTYVSGDLIVTGSINGTINSTNGVVSGSTQLTTAFPSKTTGDWSVPAGASTQSFTVEQGASYTMWVNGNIPNGIITWNATVTTSNTNVPVVGSQYGWYYTAGNALVLTAMPDQIIGTTNTLISSPASYAPNTSNVFKFGITNNSGTTQTINYGYIKLS